LGDELHGMVVVAMVLILGVIILWPVL